MALYETDSRYDVYGNTVLRPDERQEEERVVKRQRRVLPRSAVDVIAKAYVGMVALACGCILAMSVHYIQMKTAVTEEVSMIKALQNQIYEQNKINAQLENEITASATLDVILTKATKLGMKPAENDQVIYYDGSDSEYVIQKEDIPNE